MYEFRTEPSYSYQSMWLVPVSHVFTFTVSMCESASVGLNNGSHFTHEVVIGYHGNTMSSAHSLVNNVTAAAPTYHMLQCGKFVQFWVSWSGGWLRLGRDEPYGEELVHLAVTDLTVSLVALSGNGYQGIWHVDKSQGQYCGGIVQHISLHFVSTVRVYSLYANLHMLNSW